MSQQLINEYRAERDRLRAVSGNPGESRLRSVLSKLHLRLAPHRHRRQVEQGCKLVDVEQSIAVSLIDALHVKQTGELTK